MKELCLEEGKKLMDDEIKALGKRLKNAELLMDGVREHLAHLGDRLIIHASETSRLREEIRELNTKIEEEIKDVRTQVSENEDPRLRN